MALQKNKTVKGFTGNYWKIIKLTQDFTKNRVDVIIVLYKDKATRDNDIFSHVHTFEHNLNDSFHSKSYSNGADTMKSISLKEAYKVLKTIAIAEQAKIDTPVEGVEANEQLAFFSGATNV